MVVYRKYRRRIRTSIAVQWLRVHASTAAGAGSIPGWGTKILCAMQNGQKNKKRIYRQTVRINELIRQPK